MGTAAELILKPPATAGAAVHCIALSIWGPVEYQVLTTASPGQSLCSSFEK